MELFRSKETRYRNLILLLLPFIIIAGVCGFLAYRSLNSLIDGAAGTNSDDKTVIEKYDYHLRKDATELQIELFDELGLALNKDNNQSEIAKLIAENFVADFYTWTNKGGSYDIGGMHYVYPHSRINIYKQARDQFYKYVTYYKNTYGSDKLLEVETVEAVVGDQVNKYECEGNSYDSYFVTCDWTYKEGTSISTTELVTHEYFTVIYNNTDGRYEIVQAYGDF